MRMPVVSSAERHREGQETHGRNDSHASPSALDHSGMESRALTRADSPPCGRSRGDFARAVPGIALGRGGVDRRAEPDPENVDDVCRDLPTTNWSRLSPARHWTPTWPSGSPPCGRGAGSRRRTCSRRVCWRRRDRPRSGAEELKPALRIRKIAQADAVPHKSAKPTEPTRRYRRLTASRSRRQHFSRSDHHFVALPDKAGEVVKPSIGVL